MTNNSGIRKAAVFMCGLDGKTAAELLGRLDPLSARAVRREMLEISEITEPELESSATEFIRTATLEAKRRKQAAEPAYQRSDNARTNSGRILVGNDDLDTFESSGSLESRRNDRYAVPPVPEARTDSRSDATDKPFEFMHAENAGKIYRAISEERPQMIALVLANLPPALAGKVLDAFEPERKSEIVQRLMRLEETDETILREVENSLRARLTPNLMPPGKRTHGAEAIRQILHASDRTLGLQILANLPPDEHELAGCIARETLEFDDLSELNRKDWAVLFKVVDQRTALLSLVGASPKLLERIVGRFSKEEELSLRRQLRELGPIIPEDTETARGRIVREAVRLAEQGAISLP